MVNHDDDELIGALHVGAHDSSVSLSNGLAPEHRGCGVVTRACHLIRDRAFSERCERATMVVCSWEMVPRRRVAALAAALACCSDGEQAANHLGVRPELARPLP